MQEEIDNSAYDNLIEKQNSIRGKACLQFFSLPQTGVWLSATPIPAPALHLSPNEFRVLLNTDWVSKLYENERKCPLCKSGILDVMGNHAMDRLI